MTTYFNKTHAFTNDFFPKFSSFDVNGYCSCKNGFDGEKCDRCDISYGGFPTCRYGGKFIVQTILNNSFLSS